MIDKSILYLRVDLTSQKIVAGGSVAHTLGVISGLLEQGATVHCATTFMNEEIEQLKPNSYKLLTIPTLFKLFPWRIISLFTNISQFFQIMFFSRTKKIDYIYQRHALMSSVGAFLSFFKRIPLILEYNGSEVWVDTHWGGKKSWKKLTWLTTFFERLSLWYAHTIVVVSQPLKEELMARGINKDKILVNPNGVDTEVFDPEKLQIAREQIRNQFNLTNKYVFGFIGSFSLWHGINILEKIIPQVVSQKPQAHFLLIGDGPLKEELETALRNAGITSEHVTFTGSVPQSKGREYLAACDAFLSPTQPNKDGTRFFGSPTKVFEYMSLAKPIVASDLEQLKELIYPAYKVSNGSFSNKGHAGQVGFLLSPEDENGFASLCVHLVDADKTRTQEIGRDARLRAEQEYTWQVHVKKIVTYLQR